MTVLVDKPFASSVEEADGVIKLAKEKGLLLTCFQNRRYVSDSTVHLHAAANNDSHFSNPGWRFPNSTGAREERRVRHHPRG